jgi:hypothetical protein
LCTPGRSGLIVAISFSVKGPLRRCGLLVSAGRSRFDEFASKCGSRISASELLRDVLPGQPEWSSERSLEVARLEKRID